MTRFKAAPSLQLDSNDCGPACLRYMVEHYGGKISSSDMRSHCHMDESGMSLLDIRRAADEVGLACRVYEADRFDQELGTVTPWLAEMIAVHDGSRHFVVVLGIKAGWVKLMDPAHGFVRISEEEFTERWQNIVVTFEPTREIWRGQGSLSQIMSWALRKPRTYYLAFASLLSLLGSAIGIGVAFIMQSFVDSLTLSPALEEHWPLLLGLMSLMLVQYFLGAGGSYVIERIVLSMILRSSREVAGQLDQWEWQHFVRLKSGDLLNRFQDPEHVERFLLSMTSRLIAGGLSSLVGLLLLAIMFPHLAPAVLVALVIPVVSFNVIRAPLLAVSYRQKMMDVSIDGLLIDYIRSNETLRSIGSSGDMIDRYIRTLKEKNRLSMWRMLLLIILGLSMSLAPVVVIGWAVFSVWELSDVEHGGVGGLVFQLAITVFVFGNLSSLLDGFSAMTSLRVNFERLLEVAQRATSCPNLAAEGVPSWSEDGSSIHQLRLREFGFRVGDEVSHVSAEVEVTDGDGPVLVALTGPNGVGKSSFMRALAGVSAQVEGAVEVNGVPVNPRSLSGEAVSYLPQKNHLVSGDVLDNILLGRDGIDLAEVERLAGALELPRGAWRQDELRAVPVVNGGENFSGGQGRRITLVRTLATSSRLLLLDEPFDSLDRNAVDSVFGILRASDRDIVIISTHDESVVRACDMRLDLQSEVAPKRTVRDNGTVGADAGIGDN